MTNPFVYSRPVSPEELVDRDAEANQVVDLADGGHATRLSAPRRYGKTSLLNRVKRDAEAAGMACVYVDFSRAVSLGDVAVTIEHAYRRSLQGPIRRAAVAVIRTLQPRARVTPGGVGLEVEPRLDPEATRRLGELLDLPVGLHERTGRRTLVIFDEFQELLAAGDQLDSLFRSRIQHHGDAASYIYAGSHPGLMRELFADRERPLYGQARSLHLDPLSDPDLADHIADRFQRSGRDAGTALEPLLDFVQGHPQRAMMFAHHLWANTSPAHPASAETFGAAVEDVRDEAGDALQGTWESLRAPDRSVVAAIASSEHALLGARTLRTFGLAKSTAREARARLVDTGVLHRVGESYVVADPLLADFAAHRIPKPDDDQ